MEENLEMENFMAVCLKSAKEQLEETGDVTMITFIRPKNKAEFLKKENIPRDAEPMAAIPFDMVGNKDRWYAIIGSFVERFGAYFSVMVAESWYSEDPELKEDGTPKFAPSKDPNRKDCISVIGVKYDDAGLVIEQTSLMLPFDKKGNKIEFLELVTIKGEEGEGVRSELADVTARQDLI
jgi:hypothetical protein